MSKPSKGKKETVATQLSAIKIKINGCWHTFEHERDIKPTMTLSYLLREKLGYTGLKVSCDEGACGACTVIMDGKAILSCMTLAVAANGH
ncbi:MAG: 2Fe-2S iron-sulfur cluster binding domain-containing protein, partial [Desulfobacula sp.]|nr:2Fe-2S iron-sulfur cluster binding domain-containing protein [Desulfobacula sp.]